MSDLSFPPDASLQNPAAAGAWQVVGRSGVVGMHAALLHTGQVLFFARPEEPSHRLNTLDNGLPGDHVRPEDAPDVTLSTVFDISGPNAYRPTAVQVEHNPFCSGHTFLADGRLLVAGGDKKGNLGNDPHDDYGRAPVGTKSGTNRLRVFTPSDTGPGEWKDIGKLSDSRWYPTCTLLPDGGVFIVSGSIDDQYQYNNQNPTCENIPPLPNGSQYLHLLVEAWPYHSYPFVFVLPSGSLFLFAKDRAYLLKLALDGSGRKRWAVEDGPKLTRKAGSSSGPMEEPAKHYPNNATAVLLPLLPHEDPAKAYGAEVLVIGGAGVNVYEAGRTTGPPNETETFQVDALDSCYRLDVHPPNSGAAWRSAAPMSNARVMPDAVLLPDGTVLVVNGVKKGFAGGYPGTGPAVPKNPAPGADEEYAVRVAELYDPFKDQWETLAAATCTRLYHSTALLLPDARVLVAGSDHQVNERGFPLIKLHDPDRDRRLALSYEYQVEIFTPPYLFRNVQRPVIEAVQERIVYGQRFEIKVSAPPDTKDKELSAALLSPGSVTHCNNMSQRYVGLRIVDRSSTHLILQAPPNANIAPPGYYMLFLLDRGVPSEARFVRLLLEPAGEAAEAKPPSAGLELWLRADTGIVADANGSVSSWSDLSGHDNDVVWKSGAAPGQPELPPKWMQNELNGQAIVRFSLVSTRRDNLVARGGALESTKRPFLPGPDPYSVFLVTHPWPGGGGPNGLGGMVAWGDYNAPHSNTVVAFRLGPGPLMQRLPMEPGKASIVTYWDWRDPRPPEGKQIGDDSNAPVPLSRAVLLETSFDGARWRMRLNANVLNEAPVNGKNTGSGPLTIGRTGPVDGGVGEFFRGDIAEILIYDRALTEHAHMQVEEYLRNRYALW